MLEHIIIGTILDDELTGYDIKKQVETGVGNFYKVSYGSLYPTLKKLVDKDFLIKNEQKEGKRAKIYYRATDSGKEAFQEWLNSPFDFSLGAPSLVVKIYFFGRLPKEARKQQLQEYEMYYRQSLRKLKALGKRVSEKENMDYFMLSTLYYGIRNMQTAIEWLKHIGEEKKLSEFIEEDE